MLDLKLQRFDGIALRVKGDGQTYKFNLKTADQMNVPESTYQAQYDTVKDEWVTVYMPWHEFVPVTRAQYDAKAKPFDPAQVKQIGLVLSRFHYNSLPNQRFRPGNFELQVSKGWSQCPCSGSYRHITPACGGITHCLSLLHAAKILSLSLAASAACLCMPTRLTANPSKHW